MKRFCFLLTLMLCSAALPAQLQFDRELVDLGEVEGERMYRLTFPFENAGTTTVRIVYAKPTSSNVSPDYPPGEILPGTRDSIVVGVSTRTRRGPFYVMIRVLEEGETQPHRLALKGKIIEPKPFDPGKD